MQNSQKSTSKLKTTIHIKRIKHCDHLWFVPGCKDGTISTNQSTLTKWRIKIMFLSVDGEKVFDKIHHLFMIKLLIKWTEKESISL